MLDSTIQPCARIEKATVLKGHVCHNVALLCLATCCVSQSRSPAISEPYQVKDKHNRWCGFWGGELLIAQNKRRLFLIFMRGPALCFLPLVICTLTSAPFQLNWDKDGWIISCHLQKAALSLLPRSTLSNLSIRAVFCFVPSVHVVQLGCVQLDLKMC